MQDSDKCKLVQNCDVVQAGNGATDDLNEKVDAAVFLANYWSANHENLSCQLYGKSVADYQEALEKGASKSSSVSEDTPKTGETG